MWVGREVPIWVETNVTCYRFSGVAGLEGCSPLELMEGVAREEGYCTRDLLVRVVGRKEMVTRAEKDVGWNVKLSPRHVELPICSGISLQVS